MINKSHEQLILTFIYFYNNISEFSKKEMIYKSGKNFEKYCNTNGKLYTKHVL